jgi:hypothetical protein
MRNKMHVVRNIAAGIIMIFGISACGGGSSGTGESEDTGIILDSSCVPVPNVNLAELGIEAVEEASSENGTFTIIPDSDDSIAIPSEPESGGDTPVSVDLSEPTCVVISYEDATVSSVLSFPQEELSECSVSGIQQAYPDGLNQVCDNNLATSLE